MNRYLIDTHTAIWFFNGDQKLSEKAKQIIRDRSNPIYLSIASALIRIVSPITAVCSSIFMLNQSVIL